MNEIIEKVKPRETGTLKIIPIGGMNEIGKNLTVLEYQDDIMIIDCGLSFPDDDMYGVDIVIPDFSYLIKNKRKIRGVVITHGHEDHIGAIPYLLKVLNVPIYATRLPMGLIESKLVEHNIKARKHTFKAGDKLRLGRFKVETIRTTHSIVDAVCLSIETPVGRVFHTGDFKVDYTPIDGEPMDFAKLAEIGSKGVMLMMADSTNATRPGYTASEKTVGLALENIFRRSQTRIIISTFSSNVNRVQRIVDVAVQFGRKVTFSGRSMEKVAELAQQMGYLKIPAGSLVDLKNTRNLPDKEVVIITTGSQGEPMAALSRIANSDHRGIQLRKGDMIILSSSPIPGNEKTVANIVNKFFELGAEVIYSDIAETHVSGHACQEELKLMHALIRPKFFMPVHGEYRHLKAHAALAEDQGMKSEDIFILNNGHILQTDGKQMSISKEVVPAEAVMVDGLGVGDVGSVVLNDRKMLSESGLIIVVATMDKRTRMMVSGPDIISRGFIYVRDNEDLIAEARQIVSKSLEQFDGKKRKDWAEMKSAVRDDLKKFIYSKTKRNPVILPIFMEVDR
jgi:ribonuclease J